MLYTAEVKVSLKKGVLDPQGSTVEGAVKTMGYTGVADVRFGKLVTFQIEAETEADAQSKVAELGKRILANPVMETYTFTVTPAQEVK